MKTDGIFTTHVVEVPFKKYGKPITLWASGDWHYNSRNCDTEKLLEFFDNARGDYLIGMGDYLDSISSSERKAFRKLEAHDSTVHSIEQLYRGHVEDLVEKLRGVNVLAMCGGNHHYKFDSGITTDQLLCDKLGCIYTGVNAFIRLILRQDKTHAHAIDIVIHHGQSGGRSVGASLNKLEKMCNFFNADIVLQGHDHNRAVDYFNRLELSSNNKLHNKKIMLARTGSFLRAYEEGVPSYAVDAAYAPADLGALKIELIPTRVHRGRDKATGKRIDDRFIDIQATI